MDKKTNKRFEGFTYLRTVLLVVGAILLWWLVHNMPLVGQAFTAVGQLLFPIAMGLIIAFLLNIPMRFFERVIFRGRGGRAARPVSLILAIIVVLLILFLVVNTLIPNFIDAIGQLLARLPRYMDQVEQAMSPYLEQYAPSIQEWLDENDDLLTGMLNEAFLYLQSIGSTLFTSTVNVATSILGQAAKLLIAFVITLHLLLGKERLLAQADGVLLAYLPAKHYGRVKRISSLTYQTYSSFVSGLCLEALLEGVLYFVILSIGGFDYTLLISIMMAFAALVPVIGAWVGTIFGALLLLLSMGPLRMLAFIIITLIIQQIGSSVLIPQVVGQSIGLPAIWTLVAVVIGSGVGGVFGILFFIPLLSVIYTLTRQHTVDTLGRKGIANPVALLSAKKKAKRRD
ncbi:AI-2E family transporter [Eubacteriales bacterium OttesenSCG-928-A19]|nr:AI-2E family transporter [Eubacteriales bacterium OttesenSCG-928-A19]